MESRQPGETVAGGFFSRLDWTAFWTATLISLAVYIVSLPPSVTLEDSGEFAVAADWLGVPHPPGYPLWTMMAWVFARIFSFVTFRGQPNPAWGIALLSAVCGALATGITAMLITRSGSDMLGQVVQGEEKERGLARSWICGVAGVSASLLFAFSPVMWSQSVIIEVYSLNALFLMLIFLLTYRWMLRPSDKLLWLTGFVFGLGLTNYQVLLFAAAPLAVVILLRDLGLFRDFVLLGLPYVVGIVILQLGALPSSTPGFPKHSPLPPASPPAPLAPPVHAPLINPSHYIWVAVLAGLVVAACVTAAIARQRGGRQTMVKAGMIGGGVLLLALLLYLHFFLPGPPAQPASSAGEVFSWLPYQAGFFLALCLLLALSMSLPSGPMYAMAVFAILWSLSVLLYRGALLGLTHPTSFWFQSYVVINFVFLGLGFLMLPRGRSAALSFFTVQAGLAVYAYMPIVSDLRNPPMNWGYPRTWEGFKHAITRGQYERIAPTDIFSRRFIEQVGDYFTDLRTQFTLIVAPLGMLPFAVWRFRGFGRRISALRVGIILFLVSFAYVAIGEFLGWEAKGVFRLDKLVLSGLLLIMVAGSLIIAFNAFDAYVNDAFNRRHHISRRIMAGLTLVGLAAAVSLFMYRLLLWLVAGEDDPTNMTRVLTVFGSLLVSTFLLVGLWIVKRALERENDLGFDLDYLSQRWLIATAIGFAMMSLLLVALANPKGDLQDMFVQKVKFISSHALFALWIGYGLIFGLRFVQTMVGRRRRLFQGALCLAALLPLLPIEQNLFNRELIRVYGAAEQTGHDFGWQFGNYQLRGVEAILEELDRFEEPPPNPFYPPPMSEGAVFFGGTDPGRFVPTYMIYSARVREDIYLITQNALADHTYMSVMRDLYGDEVWLPTPQEAAQAFATYVEEVKSGKRRRSAQLTVRDGRVQVSGALGVMEINGIISERMFRKNRDYRDFYIEESYVIPWMYPYLSPHGLCMKINQRKVDALSGREVRNNNDFWDWYSRRLLDNRSFRRDVAARKSFSKLRSAQGGLYASRGMFREAERAFNESRLLYRESPEATFRLINEVLLRLRRYDDALDLLQYFARLDPNNARTPAFIETVSRRKALTDRLREIMDEAGPRGAMRPASLLEVADIYRQFGQNEQAKRLLMPMLETPGLSGDHLYEAAILLNKLDFHSESAAFLDQAMEKIDPASPSQLLRAARIYAQAGQPGKMVAPLREYLQGSPSDWKAWLDLASVHLIRSESRMAGEAMRQALRAGGMEAVNHIRRNNLLRGPGEPLIQEHLGETTRSRQRRPF